MLFSFFCLYHALIRAFVLRLIYTLLIIFCQHTSLLLDVTATVSKVILASHIEDTRSRHSIVLLNHPEPPSPIHWGAIDMGLFSSSRMAVFAQDNQIVSFLGIAFH
ncbi:hypothetical protein QCA50_016190 [Cerrena zonata]|uniref:Uncharacterized protein n=1 Tax=Cerrena zonata TaxID=2478898 RepID=A0AAW0FH60_9APHY